MFVKDENLLYNYANDDIITRKEMFDILRENVYDIGYSKYSYKVLESVMGRLTEKLKTILQYEYHIGLSESSIVLKKDAIDIIKRLNKMAEDYFSQVNKV